MRSNILPWLSATDYDAFRSLLGDDLPPTYNEWREDAEKLSAKDAANGIVVNCVQVNAEEYIRYCKASGLDTNIVTLNAFAVAKAYKR